MWINELLKKYGDIASIPEEELKAIGYARTVSNDISQLVRTENSAQWETTHERSRIISDVTRWGNQWLQEMRSHWPNTLSPPIPHESGIVLHSIASASLDLQKNGMVVNKMGWLVLWLHVESDSKYFTGDYFHLPLGMEYVTNKNKWDVFRLDEMKKECRTLGEKMKTLHPEINATLSLINHRSKSEFPFPDIFSIESEKGFIKIPMQLERESAIRKMGSICLAYWLAAKKWNKE